MAEKRLQIFDFSGGVQTKTTKFLRRVSEVEHAVNVDLETIGGISKRKGYTQKGPTFTSTTTSTTTTTSTSSSTTTTSTSTTTTSTSTTTTSTSTTTTSTSTSTP